MRIEPKTAAVYAAGAFFFLLIFGVGWPGPGTWLLVFSLLLIAAAAAAWWLDGAIVPQQRAGAVLAGAGASTPFGGRRRAPSRGAGRPGDSILLSLGFPGPDGHGRWVLPDRVHLTALAGAVGLLAMIIFIAGALGGGGGDSSAATTGTQTAPALDFASSNGQSLLPATDGAAIAPLPPGTVGDGAANPQTGTLNADGTALVPQAGAAGQATAQTSPIVVETPSAPIPAPARALDAPDTLPTSDQAVVHEVVSGDTIYDLAITYGSSIEAILAANGLGENSTINIADRLLIPAVETSGASE